MTIQAGPATLYVPGDDGGWQQVGRTTGPVTFTFDLAPYDDVIFAPHPAFGKFRATAVAPLTRQTHDLFISCLFTSDLRWHRRRCRFCNPWGNPLPMPKSGYDYNQRRKARIRRRRR